MIRIFAIVLTLVLTPAGLTGCSDECTDLAAIACEGVGAEHDECKRAQDKAAKASRDDKRACRQALEIVKEFTNQ